MFVLFRRFKAIKYDEGDTNFDKFLWTRTEVIIHGFDGEGL